MKDALLKGRTLKIADWIEAALSVLFFTGMFGAIVVQVFSRYVLQTPLVWPYELSIYCFIYIVFVGAGMAARCDSHIVFEMIYDRFSRKNQLLIRIATNLFVIAVFLSVFPSTFSFIKFMWHVKSSSLGIPMFLILLSFPFGMGLIVLYLFLWTVKVFQTLRVGKG